VLAVGDALRRRPHLARPAPVRSQRGEEGVKGREHGRAIVSALVLLVAVAVYLQWRSTQRHREAVEGNAALAACYPFMLAAALAGSTGWLKVSVIARGALASAPADGIEAVTVTWASAGAASVESARAAKMAGMRMKKCPSY
jgi:hypothetical protein